MEYDERASELEREAERLEHESKRLEEKIGETRDEWDAKKSDSQAPGAVGAEDAGPHNIDAEDAKGHNYGQEERTEEFESAQGEDAESGEDSG
jgi:phage shock protein A